MHVEVSDVDELRPMAVRARRDLAREVLLAGFGAHGHDLAGLDVRAETDDEVRQPGESRGVDPIRGGAHDARG